LGSGGSVSESAPIGVPHAEPQAMRDPLANSAAISAMAETESLAVKTLRKTTVAQEPQTPKKEPYETNGDLAGANRRKFKGGPIA
jgi:hypothetical protein